MDAQEAFPLKTLEGTLRRRLYPMALAAGSVFLAAVFLAALLPSQYEASTTILIEPQAISSRLVEGNLADSDLRSRLHLMTMQILSRARLSRVIDEFGLYAEQSRRQTREEVIERMRSRIRVEPVLPQFEAGAPRRSREADINTFQLFFRYDSPKVAADVANRLANDFIDEHIRERVQVSGDTAEFIDSELARLAEQIRELESRIAQVKAENAGQLPEDMVSNQRLLERAIGSLRAAERELAQARSDEAFYRQQALSSAAAGGPEDAVSPARRLRLLELQLAEHRSRGFTDKHPDVIATQQEIAALRQRIAAGALGPGEPLSLVQQNARAEQRRAALRAQAARSEIEGLQKQIDRAQARLAATPRVAEQLDGLERQYQHLLASYQEFSSKRLSAAVAANMERRQKGEQFRVLEAAYPPPEPASPNRALILVLGVLLGLGLGGALGLALEGADSSFHDARGLQQQLGIPVLAAIPAILLDSERAALRRRRRRHSLALGALVCLLLGAAALGYVWAHDAGTRTGVDGAERAPASQTLPRDG